jgi:RNA polymerase sigma-70 factor (ECF subfamily)
VLQTAYLRCLSGEAGFEGRSAFRTWLFGVIRLTALERRRKAAVRRLLLGRWQEWEESVEPPDSPHDFIALLRELPGRQREVLFLVFHQEMTVEEAAGVMGIGVGTARTHYERGKRALRARYPERKHG